MPKSDGNNTSVKYEKMKDEEKKKDERRQQEFRNYVKYLDRLQGNH